MSEEQETDRIRSITLDCDSRRIKFQDAAERSVEVCFPEKKPDSADMFGACLAIALAQKRASSPGAPCKWRGVTDEFVASVILDHQGRTRWKVGNWRNYWSSFRSGQGDRRKACRIRVDDKLPRPVEQKGLATGLFRRVDGRSFLGGWCDERGVLHCADDLTIFPPEDEEARGDYERLEEFVRGLEESEGEPDTPAGGDRERTPSGVSDSLQKYINELLGRYGDIAAVEDQKLLSRGAYHITRCLSAVERSERSFPTVQDQSMERRRSEPEPIQQSELLQKIYDTPGLRLCVTGDGGTGKSTLLQELTLLLADGYKDGLGLVPVTIDLGLLEGYLDQNKPTSEATVRGLALFCNESLEGRVLDALLGDEGKAVLLIDGLDEAHTSKLGKPVGDWLDRQLRFGPIENCRVILASRPWALRHEHGLRSHFGEVKLSELTPTEIFSYIGKYFPVEEEAARVGNHIRRCDQIRMLVKTPLYLALLCLVAEDLRLPLPRTEGELIESALAEMIRRRRERIRQCLGAGKAATEPCLKVLARMAWSWWHAPEPSHHDASAQEEIAKEVASSRSLRKEFKDQSPSQVWEALSIHSGIVAKTGLHQYEFVQPTFQEYLAGRWLAEQDGSVIIKEFGQNVWKLGWRRALRFMAGRLWRNGNAVLAERLVRWLVAEHEAGRDERWGYLVQEASWLLSIATQSELETRRDLAERIVSLLDPVFRDAARAEVIIHFPPVQQIQDYVAEALKGGDAECRTLAATMLAEIGGSAAVEVLVEALEDDSEDLKLCIIDSLSRLGGSNAVKALVELLRDGDVLVREYVVGALHRIGGREAVNGLMAAVKDEERTVSDRALTCLGELGTADAIAVLERALSEDRIAVRYAAIQSLGTCRSRRAVELLVMALEDDDYLMRAAAATALSEQSDARAVDALLESMGDGNALVRCSSARSLGKLGSRKAIDVLLSSLKDRDKEVRWLVVDALRKLGGSRVVNELAGLLKHEDPDMRACAIRALGALGQRGEARATKVLRQTARERVGELRSAAVAELGGICDSQDDVLLRTFVNDRDPDLRYVGVWALARIGGAEALKPLMKALGDKEARVRCAATVALSRLGIRGAENALMAGLRDGDYSVRLAAAVGLGKLGSQGAVDELLKALGDKHSHVRAGAAASLGRLGGGRAIEGLITALSDADFLVRCKAIDALGELGDQCAVEKLATVLKDGHPLLGPSVAHVLGKIGGQAAVNALAEALTDSSRKLGHAAAKALGRLSKKGCRQALDALTEGVTKGDGAVCSGARAALGESVVLVGGSLVSRQKLAVDAAIGR